MGTEGGFGHCQTIDRSLVFLQLGVEVLVEVLGLDVDVRVVVVFGTDVVLHDVPAVAVWSPLLSKSSDILYEKRHLLWTVYWIT